VKIALIGSHGVGKTTLCYDLAARLKRRDHDVELVTEVARRCPLPINRRTSIEAQAWILHSQIAREIEAEARHEVVLCDRSVLDNYCYLRHAAGRQPGLEELVTRWISTYRLLVKVPICNPPRWDGVRDTDEAFQADIDALIDDELEQRGLAALHLEPATRPQWPETALARLEPLLRPMPSLFPEEG
jgi:predicted ATPase